MQAVWDELKDLTGYELDTCPWRAFNDPVVADAISAAFFHETGQLREYWGDDPPAHLPKAVQVLLRSEGMVRQRDREEKQQTQDKP